MSETLRRAGVEAPSDDAPHILVIDDDSRIRTLLGRFLGSHGFRVSTAASAGEARRQLASMRFDLLVVDVMMPGESGIEFTEDLRRASAVPVLMLTARSETPSRIRGLEVGADDYLAKPFEPRELLLRINAILKRSVEPSAAAEVESVGFGGFTFHIARGELKQQGVMVRITDRERDMLRALAARPGRTIRREELATLSAGSERAVDVQVNRLRRKIEADPANPVHLQTTRGIGYRLLVD